MRGCFDHGNGQRGNEALSMSYPIHLENFEGPLDLLLHLIDKNQMDIYDIPIAEIARQYLAYLQEMEALDLEIASSFLVMAANLLAMKARLLLPKPPPSENEEEEEDIRIDLVRDLLEYKRYKEASLFLDGLSKEQAQYVARPNEEEWYLQLFAPENPLEGKTIQDLSAAFQELLKRLESREAVMNLQQCDITIGDKMEDIYNLLRRESQGLPFGKVFSQCKSKVEMVITFLALLELIKNHVLRVNQKADFAEIYLYAHDLSKYRKY